MSVVDKLGCENPSDDGLERQRGEEGHLGKRAPGNLGLRLGDVVFHSLEKDSAPMVGRVARLWVVRLYLSYQEAALICGDLLGPIVLEVLPDEGLHVLVTGGRHC